MNAKGCAEYETAHPTANSCHAWTGFGMTDTELDQIKLAVELGKDCGLSNIDICLQLLCTKEMFEAHGPGPKAIHEIAAFCREYVGPISREYIRQIVDGTLRKLRKRLSGDPALREAVEEFTKQK